MNTWMCGCEDEKRSHLEKTADALAEIVGTTTHSRRLLCALSLASLIIRERAVRLLGT